MKNLLSALKTELSNNIDYLADIAIVSDEDMLPSGTRFPFIGLKDGSIERVEGHSATLNERLSVSIVCYVQILKPEASIMGDGNNKGILDMMSDVHGVLNENFLDFADIDRAFCSTELASETMLTESMFIQKKKCVYLYDRSRDTP